MENKFYVYVHKSNVDHRIFYVGKGYGSRYISTSDRNIDWNRIVKKEGFYAEIVKSNISELEAFDEEVRLIKEIGRRDIGLGPLVNLTDGGEGNTGLKWGGRRSGKNNPMYGKKQSEYMKNKLRIERKGIKRPQHVIEAVKLSSSRPRLLFLNVENGVYYEGIQELLKAINLTVSKFRNKLKNNKLPHIKIV